MSPGAEVLDLGQTESLCPECLERLPARRVGLGDQVFLEKRCPRHGPFRTILWRGPPGWSEWAPPSRPAPARTGDGPGCPFECGLCPDHPVPTCCALLEVTRRCDLACRYCFAGGGGRSPDPDLAAVERWYRALLRGAGQGQAPPNVQLSGGEPTLRDDLPEIIRLGRSLGFRFFQLNTNGLRLARDPAYLRRLAEAGLSCVFLQYDGVSDDVHRRLRGAPLAAAKEAAVARCAEAGVGVVLVPTVVPGVNVAELGAILDRAVRAGPVVRGIHLQPVSYFGRFPAPPADADRITLPEVMRALEAQSGGVVRAADLRPPAAEHARCSFSGNFVRTGGGGLRARPPSRAGGGCCGGEGARRGEVRRAQEFVARRWAHPPPAAEPACCSGGAEAALDAVIAEASASAFCVSAMAFQDAWNVDLERVRECFLHVVSPDARLVPFCAYNATGAGGAPLHRGGTA
jgi:7,8-dihydro-6-hydroxymethylpterin dimethyltransferase